jgi:phage terminase large subunit GpA-like protein
MLDRGRWVQKNPGARTRSFHLSSLYSPLGWLSWRKIVQEFIRAKAAADRGDVEKLKAFTNTRLAETWEERGTTLDAQQLKDNAEDFRLRFVPSDALVLLAGVDVQDDRFEIDVYAVGPRGAMWTVDTVVLPANPGLEEDWKKLDAALLQTYEHEDGYELRIDGVAIDSGGHHTHEVYNFARGCDPRRNVHVIKGADRPGQALVGKASLVDVNTRSGQVLKGGVKLWIVGVNAAKDKLFGLMRAEPKKRIFHVSSDLDDTWFEQITAEHKVQMKTGRGTRFVYVKRKGQNRNERLDTAVYVIWLVEKLKLATWPQRVWDALRARYEAQMHAKLAAQAQPAPLLADAPVAQTEPTKREVWKDDTDDVSSRYF